MKWVVPLLAMGLVPGWSPAQAQVYQVQPLAPGTNPGDAPRAPDAPVYSVLSLPNGDVVVGGDFSRAGTVEADHVVLWDGSQWSAMGAGLNGRVRALVKRTSGEIIAAGDFTHSGFDPVNRVARWDGTSWLPMGVGFDAPAYTLAVGVNDELFAGGVFSSSGTQSTLRVARWDGADWQSIGFSAFDLGEVRALVVNPANALLVGGTFHAMTGTGANKIARWDGSWHSMSAGFSSAPVGLLASGPVSALALSNAGEMLAGGTFQLNAMRWNGTRWASLGDGPGGQAPVVHALLTLPNGDLLAGGSFDTVMINSSGSGTIVPHPIARWDGSGWSHVGTAMPGNVYALASLGGSADFIAAGSFTGTTGLDIPYIARCSQIAGLPPVILQQPASFCSSGRPSAMFAVVAQQPAGTGGEVSYQWRRNGTPVGDFGSFQFETRFRGTASSTLSIRYPTCSTSGTIDVWVSGPTGARASTPASYRFLPGDFNCSGSATIQDLFDYLNAWLAADPAAETDDLPEVTNSDIVQFIQHWFHGC